MATAATTRAPRPAPAERPLSRRDELIEVGVFLFLVVPSLALSFFIGQQQDQLGFVLTAVATMLRDLALVALVLFFLWRNGEPLRALGWTLRGAGREMALGVSLFIPLFFGSRWLEELLVRLGLSVPTGPTLNLVPTGAAQLVLAVLLVVVVAISEETIFRGYLLLRFRSILRHSGLALLLAAVVFSLGHGYEGTAGAVTVGTIGAVFGAVYLWRRSLVAPATMHFLLDGVAILLVPLIR